MSDYEQQDRGDEEEEDDYALDKGNLDEGEEAKEEELDRERDE